MIRIDRCVCFEVPFAELKRLSRTSGASTIEDLQRDIDFGLRCELCHPYVRRMLRTGETLFTEVIDDQDDAGLTNP